MSSLPKKDKPFSSLGSQLKGMRYKHKRTTSEVCGAVEIDEELLARIEAGEIRPNEDLLEQLINHYQVEDQDALNIWSLAGYDTEDLVLEDNDPLISNIPKAIIMMLSLEQRTLYTDSLDIHYSNTGLVLNFKQNAGQKKAQSVAKLGMSYEQAEQVLDTLQKVLLRHKYLKGPKRLPRGSDQ